MVIMARRSRSEESRGRARVDGAREDGNRGAAITVRECSTMNMRPSEATFLSPSWLEHARSSRSAWRRQFMYQAKKTFKHWVDIGIMMWKSCTVPDAATVMNAILPKMFFDISFVRV
jgi:hypothetical protein